MIILQQLLYIKTHWPLNGEAFNFTVDKKKMECKKDRNMEWCNCSYPGCSRKGVCCECMKYHRDMNQLPACFFPDEAEKTFDRSVEKFIETQQ